MDELELADWREQMARLHLSPTDLAGYRAARDTLFAGHPQSPIPVGQRAGFTGLRYFPASAEAVVDVPLRTAEGTEEIDTGGPDGVVRYRRVGVAETPWGPLTLWWIDAYGGGLFLPFRDGTCGAESYGGGRYLTDTVKGTFGRGVTVLPGARLRLDFNYAYNPSCAYDDRWACPLAPPENRLTARIAAGEQTYRSAGN
ncbi:DUF1684 domain-containing protein [Solwaraspora sp. WMMD1047]|uniref:DUF1684 domain-containing protein n=1 Tax=Solwaraspora sp. WMMD1047 TaxID=3016102 RepID=UPI0024167A81|nr:DUF1684 domain-containing protein [Solwaraspora sp. WMMD1047]MDG4830193.1 DUF1684 domain-containing protein [Solwaraspora sp. WMMD1047]